jgi:hypothetical protein
MSAENVSTLMQAAAAALEAGDFATARLKATSALAYAGNLIRAREGGQQREMEFSVDFIREFLDRVDKIENKSLARSGSGGGFQRTKFIYKRPCLGRNDE